MLLPSQAVAEKENGEGGGSGGTFLSSGERKGVGEGGGFDATSTWRRGGGGLDVRCAEGGRQLHVSSGCGNGRAAREQGREAADVRARSHSTR
jgi:hypothetical protein